MSNKIYVGKLSLITTDKQLFDHFSKAGTVISAKMAKGMDPSQNADHGYVVMASDKEASIAINKLNDSTLNGSHIKVIEVHTMDQENFHFINKNRRNFRKRR